MNKLTKDQVEEIVNEYGSSKWAIAKLERIFGEFDFTEEEYINLITEIAAEYEINNTYKEINGSKRYTSLKDAIIKVINYQLNETFGDTTIYSNQMKKVLEKVNNPRQK